MATTFKTKWRPGSRFRIGGELYKDDDGKDLVSYREVEIPASNEDTFYTIESGFVQRPDLISHKFYRRDDLAWIIMQANDFESLKDFSLGKTIRIPNIIAFNSLLT